MTELQFLEDDAPTYVAPEPRPFVEGLFDDMEFAAYRSVEAISQSGAKRILQSPLHFKFDREHPSSPTQAMAFGTFVHLCVLEPHRVSDSVCIKPNIDRRTKAGKIAHHDFMAKSAGKIALSQDDHDRASRCVDAVLANSTAQMLLKDAEVEQSLFWLDRQFGVPCKARLDIRSRGGITDLKTCTDASPEGFSRSIEAFRYNLQAAFYFTGCEHVTGSTPEYFAFVAVESEAPHAVACYWLGAPSILVGGHYRDIALARYASALKTGVWGGYQSGINEINVPRWALRAPNLV